MERVFSSKSKQSASYKYGFLKAILDNLYNTDENLILTFDQLFSKFAEVYWNLVLKHKIRQAPVIAGGKTTKLEQALWETKARCPLWGLAGASVCHFDFHPGNILVRGPKYQVIDWMTACAGNKVAL